MSDREHITLPRKVIERLVASWGRDTDGFYGSMDFLRAALAAPSEDIETLRRDAERLRGLLAEAQKAVWMNYDNDLLDRIEAALKEVPR